MRTCSPSHRQGSGIYPPCQASLSPIRYLVSGYTPARLQKTAHPLKLWRVSSLQYRARLARLLWNPRVIVRKVADVSSCEGGTGIPYFPISVSYVLEPLLNF